MVREIIDFIKNNKWYVLLVVLLLGLYFYQFHGGLSSDSEKWDHFGSYIGGIFSAVTLLSVLHGMQLERKRFNEQKEEFENDKRVLEERRRKEDFERTFFMMLEQHNETLRFLENKDFGTPKRILKSDIVYKRSIVDNIYYYMAENVNDFNKIRNELDKDVYYSDLNAYFINLYRILRFIYKNKSMNIDNEYSSLIRSFLSRKMLLILAYHLCDRDVSYDNFKLYIEEFAFLEHMDFIEIEKDFINTAAFNFLNYTGAINNISYIFENYHSNSAQELISYIDESGNFSDDGYEFIKKIILSKKGLPFDAPLMKDIHFEGVKHHLFIHILNNFHKDCFLGNRIAESAYITYTDLIVQER